jgi:diguanylate cyclase (GGDEF)-like protein
MGEHSHTGYRRRTTATSRARMRLWRARERDLLELAWEALNVARENKALTLVRDGTVIAVNGLALELCERPAETLRGLAVAELLDVIASDEERWETDLRGPEGQRIAVEVTRQTLSGRIPRVEAYAIRDVRARRAAADHAERQSRLIARQERDLRAQNSKLDAALSNMFQGLAMFDAEQRVIIANDRFAEMYGQRPEDVRPGTPLRQIIEHRIARGLYLGTTVEEVLGRMRARVERQKASHMTARMGDGRKIAVSIMPRPDGGWVTTHQDITEREELNARVAEQHEQLEATLENMLQGVAMFDAAQKLVVCNRQYREMYGLTDEQVRPGTTVQQILEYRVANRFYHVSDTEAFVNSWTSNFGDVSSRIQELADGRIISVTRRMMANGGRLITHEDITERQKLNTRLAEQHVLLREQETKLKAQNLQLDAALNNIVQGLAMFDAEYRLVLCNRRYTEIYGLEAAQVAYGTTLRQIIEHRVRNGLHADRSSDDLVDAMLRRRAEGRFEQFLSQLSDGRTIAITVQAMADGWTVTTHQDVTEQRRSEAKITHMALHDALTGLPNRVLLNERLQDSLARSKRGKLVATHMLDLDRFKQVNDTLGHAAGDGLLQMAAQRLRGLARESDTIARMGGDEFAIVQVGISRPADAKALACRVIEVLSAPFDVCDHQVVIGTSVGIAIGPSDGDGPDQILRNADLALYRAKGDGRGTYRFFEQEMDTQMQARRALESELRRALPAEEFELHYQPVVDLATNDISGFEALIRWRHPNRGLVAPGSFISLAEEIGLIVPLGEWVIREACATAVGWPPDLKVAVNLSAAQFKNPGLVNVIASALANSGLPAERLELEITETILLHNSEATLAMLYQLRALGVRIAMDDFGTGYSSLSYLQRFPFDKIKIDRSFVKDIAENVGSINIVRAVAALAQGLGIQATAEGVETQQQLEAIKAEGCSEMQGFLFSRPLPACDIEAIFLARRRAFDDGARVA